MLCHTQEVGQETWDRWANLCEPHQWSLKINTRVDSDDLEEAYPMK